MYILFCKYNTVYEYNCYGCNLSIIIILECSIHTCTIVYYHYQGVTIHSSEYFIDSSFSNLRMSLHVHVHVYRIYM